MIFIYHTSSTRVSNLIYLCLFTRDIRQRWFSGRILACHAGGPGSIPGRCKFCMQGTIYQIIGGLRNVCIGDLAGESEIQGGPDKNKYLR